MKKDKIKFILEITLVVILVLLAEIGWVYMCDNFDKPDVFTITIHPGTVTDTLIIIKK